MDSSRGTKYSEEQKKIKNRPRNKSKDIVALITAHDPMITEDRTIVNQVIPIDCVLDDICIEVEGMNKPRLDIKVELGEGAMKGAYTFQVRKGKTQLDKTVEIRKGTKLKVIVKHPDEFTAEGVYFSSSLKR